MKRIYIEPITEIICIDNIQLLDGSVGEFGGPLNARGYEYIWDEDEDLWDEL